MSSHLSGYRELPKLTGFTHIIIAFIGRLPIAMIVIGVLTLVTAETGSVSHAAFASAALAISTGVGNPIIGRLTDNYGQRSPLIICAPINMLALVCLVLVTQASTPLWLIMMICAVIGFTTTPVGALARVRWYPLARKPYQLSAALSWESVADEMAFVLGPAAVGILAATLSPKAPLLIAAAIVLTCVIPFALSEHALGPQRHEGNTPSFWLIVKAVKTPIAAMAFLGMFFGAMQTTVTAFAQSSGNEGQAGLIYSAMGLGAAITALGSVVIPNGVSFTTRIIVSACGMAVFTLITMTASSPLVLGLLILLPGLAIGPLSVSIFTLAGKCSPKGGDALAVTAIGSVNVLGVALSSSITGRIVETTVSHGFLIAASCALLIALSAWLTTVGQKSK